RIGAAMTISCSHSCDAWIADDHGHWAGLRELDGLAERGGAESRDARDPHALIAERPGPGAAREGDDVGGDPERTHRRADPGVGRDDRETDPSGGAGLDPAGKADEFVGHDQVTSKAPLLTSKLLMLSA